MPTYNPQFTKGKSFKCARRTFSENYANQKPTVQKSNGRRFPRDYIKSAQPSENFSLQQKPVPLLEYLIKMYTDAGETVLDATMGSGSTSVAAINTGRKFIGFETEQKFFDIAKQRIDKAIAEGEQSLFDCLNSQAKCNGVEKYTSAVFYNPKIYADGNLVGQRLFVSLPR